MTVRALMPSIGPDGTTIMQLYGAPALRAVTWTVQSGPGTVTGLTPTTDETGTAWAVYDPGGIDGAAVVRASYGA
jgi:hypothetical protein